MSRSVISSCVVRKGAAFYAGFGDTSVIIKDGFIGAVRGVERSDTRNASSWIILDRDERVRPVVRGDFFM